MAVSVRLPKGLECNAHLIRAFASKLVYNLPKGGPNRYPHTGSEPWPGHVGVGVSPRGWFLGGSSAQGHLLVLAIVVGGRAPPLMAVQARAPGLCCPTCRSTCAGQGDTANVSAQDF